LLLTQLVCCEGNKSEDDIVEEFLRWVSIIYRYSRVHLNGRFEALDLGITSSQHFFIRRICTNAGITQDKLQPLINLNKSNIARALDTLEKGGFIRKERSKRDKRTAKLYPTETAERIYPEIVSEENAWINTLLRDFTEEEIRIFESMLQKAARIAMEEALDDFTDEK
jgi:DNA-binding MarR family transcriptional regulator